MSTDQHSPGSKACNSMGTNGCCLVFDFLCFLHLSHVFALASTNLNICSQKLYFRKSLYIVSGENGPGVLSPPWLTVHSLEVQALYLNTQVLLSPCPQCITHHRHYSSHLNPSVFLQTVSGCVHSEDSLCQPHFLFCLLFSCILGIHP